MDLPGSVPTHRGAEKTRQGRDRCTLDTAVNASFETEMDLDYKKLSVGCIGCERVKSSVESVQMVHTNLMPPHSIIPVSAGSWRTPKVFHVQLLSFTIIAPLGTLYLSLYTIHIFCLLYLHIYVTYVLFKMVFRHPCE